MNVLLKSNKPQLYLPYNCCTSGNDDGDGNSSSSGNISSSNSSSIVVVVAVDRFLTDSSTKVNGDHAQWSMFKIYIWNVINLV